MNFPTDTCLPLGKSGRAGLISLCWLAGFHLACANPTGPQIASGTATITSVPGTLSVNQSTTNAIINWQSFSINAGELTQFNVPNAASATLNRVTGGNVSAIYGTLQSNGQLYLLNPNGILVGPSGIINTAGFVGSTLSLSDAEFEKRASLNFSGASTAGVTNQGTIHTGMGDVYLIGTQVENSGTISAPNGTVGLAAGSQVLLQTAGDQHLFVQAGGNSTPKTTGVKNSGNIVSAAVELKAAGGNAYAMAINNSGNITATGITQIDGQVYLTAPGGNITNSGKISAKKVTGGGGKVVITAHSTDGTTKGTLLNSGTITATGTAPGSTGGTVELLGDKVGVIDRGVVDVSGDAGGGTALIGGDAHGANPDIADADQTYLGPDAIVAANALTLGNGGKVILWANDTTQAYGHISVTGGVQGGNGGFVETSAAQLDAKTAPNLSAPHGTPGTWLLDPSTVLISDASSDSDSGFNPSPAFTITSGSATISQTTLLAALQSGSVTIDASQGGGEGIGTITWTQPNSTPFDISSLTMPGTTLTLNAPGQISLSGITVHSSNGSGSLSLSLNLNQFNEGTVSIVGSTLNLNGGNFTANGNSAAAVPGTPGVSITGNSAITTGNGNIFIQGTGVLATASDAIGVQIANSTLTVGSAVTPGTGSLDIEGYSDAGTTTLTPNSTFANNSYGVELTSSTLTSYAASHLKVHGVSYAANNLNAYGTYINGGTILVTANQAHIKGRVHAESFIPDSGSSSGEANFISGVYTVGGAQITANGAKANVSIDGSTKDTTATDNGDTSIHVRNVGVNLTDGTVVSAAGDGQIADGNIAIVGDAGASISSLSNTFETDSIGVWLHENGGGTGLGGTITDSGLGGIALGGIGGDATGPHVFSTGVIIGDSNEVAAYVTATNGGYIALGGTGGIVSPNVEGTSFNADNFGVFLNNGHVSTTSGVIGLFGLAGQVSATQPSGSTVDSAGVGLVVGSTVTTNLTSAGAQSHNGIVIQPTILLYGSNGGIDTTKPVSFVPGTGGFAVQEDSTSSLTSENLVMGDFYNLISAFATPAQLTKLTSTDQTKVMNFLTTHNVSINPIGTIDLSSQLNQISNLDSAWVGTGGLNFYDSISLTVDPIGATDNANYGQIDLPASGSVFIQTAGDLTLTPVSPITGQASTQPIIATTGTGNNITLVAGDAFINQASDSIPALSLSNGAVYHLYLNTSFIDSNQLGNLMVPDNIVGNTPYPNSISAIGNVIAYSGAVGPSPSPTPTPPVVTTQTALDNIPPPTLLGDITINSDVIGGAGGVATLKGRKLPRGTNLAAIVTNDLKDGSTVNTGTLIFKWAANTGLSKLVLAGENAYIGLGTTGPGIPDPFLALFPGVTGPTDQSGLGAAVFGHLRPPGADIDHGPTGNH